MHDPASGATASIDAPEAAPVEAALKKTGWRLTDILVTHHHGDHTAGIGELKAHHKCRVVAPRNEAQRIAHVDETVGEGDSGARSARCEARVIETPGHTAGHISYFFPADKLAFVGDTLFSIGCGRVIEGTPEMMWHSLLKLRALPDDTQFYCGHEYTARQYPLRQDHRAEQQGAGGARRRGDEAPRRGQADHSGDDRRGKGRQSLPARRRCRGGEIASGLPAVRPGRCSRKSASARTGFDGMSCIAAQTTSSGCSILQPHPEGGHFRETFRDPRQVAGRARFDRDLFSARARRALALAPRRCGRGLALVCRRAACA